MNIKQEILKAFHDHPDQFISGEELSQACGCSRTAVWKHIEELRQEGYEIEAVRKSGYRLLAAPDSILGEEIMLNLDSRFIGRHVISYDSVVSTQPLAHEAAAKGAVEGTLILAEEQTGGKGRMGRPWHSPKGSGIWMSLILRPDIPLPTAPQITLLTAVAMAKTMQDVLGVEARIKWPNDIFIQGKKVCGILTELNAEAHQIKYLIVGMGINANLSLEEFPLELREIATSLQIEAGSPIRRASFIQAFCRIFERLYEGYLEHGFAPIRAAWEANSYTIGRQVQVYSTQTPLSGTAVGLDSDGVLIVRDALGQEHKVYSADVEVDAKK